MCTKKEYQSEKAVQIHKIQRLMLSLFTNFRLSEVVLQKVGDNADPDQRNPIVRSQATVHYLQVCKPKKSLLVGLPKPNLSYIILRSLFKLYSTLKVWFAARKWNDSYLIVYSNLH